MSPKTLVFTAALTLTLSLSVSAQEATKPPPAAPDAGAVKPAPGLAPAGLGDELPLSVDDLRHMTPAMFSYMLPGVKPNEIDTNRNLLVEKEEIAAAMLKARAKIKANEALLLKAFDRNGNGVLDPDEREMIKQVQDALRVANDLNRRYDTDQDGVLSEAELLAMQKACEDLAERNNRLTIQLLDTNKDGVLDDSERKAYSDKAGAATPSQPRGPGATPAKAPAPAK